MTMTPRQSLLLSLGGHVGLLVLLLGGGLLLAQRFIRSEPVEVDLLPALAPGPQEGQGGQEEQVNPKPEPEKTEPEFKVVERKVPTEPTYDPSKQVDLSEMPKVAQEEFEPYKPKVSVSESGGASTPGGSSYSALVGAACKRNWTPPGRGVLGRPIPQTTVEITVARTGRIVGRRISRASGNAELDRSVLEAVDLSNPLPAFPPELTGAQRTFTVQFIPEE
jgi:TonB family protein